MGIFTRKDTSNHKTDLLAQYAPHVMSENIGTLFNYITPTLQRNDAMKVSSVAKARNLICGTAAGIPLSLYRKSTGEELGKPLWLDQPSISQAGYVTYVWTYDSLFHYGQAFWEITDLYEEDGRPRHFDWVANKRVTFDTDLSGTIVTQYYVDGSPRPMSGIGSLVTFQGFDEGILARGSATIQSAIDLQDAATKAAKTPFPAGTLKNNGADLDPKEIQGILSAWKNNRKQSSIAFLSQQLEFTATQFSPKDMMYDEAQQFLATEIARLTNVPAYMLSAEANNSMTYSNVLDERRQFVAMTLQPYLECVAQRLSMNDITANGNVIHHEIDDTFLRSDALTRLQVIEKMLQLDLISIEQARAMENLSPNGDN